MTPTYRIAVMADIHGNGAALDAVLADLAVHQPLDGIIAAGDLVCGPDQSFVLRRLAELGAWMIQGNNEKSLARMVAGHAPEYTHTAQQFSMRRWALAHLTPDELDLISALPEQRVVALPGADPIRVSHGSPRDINELVVPPSCKDQMANILAAMQAEFNPNQLDEIFQSVPEPVLIFGHTHHPWHERRGRRLALNPGAVNFPENGFVGAQYAILTWDGTRWTPEFHAVPYDLAAHCRAQEDSGFLATGPLARIFLAELLTGRDIMPGFFALSSRRMREAGCADLPYVPDDIWAEAGAAFEPVVAEVINEWLR